MSEKKNLINLFDKMNQSGRDFSKEEINNLSFVPSQIHNETMIRSD